MGKSKASKEMEHATRRFQERFGAKLPEGEYFGAVKRIKQGQYQFLHRQSDRVTHWRGQVLGQDTIMVYDSNRHRIVTFLEVRDGGSSE